MSIIPFIFFSQLLFSISDIIGRKNMKERGVGYWSLIMRPWLLLYLLVRVGAISLMLYVYFGMYVGRASVCSAAIALLITALIGSLYLKEKSSIKSLIGLILIVIALVLQGWR